MQKIYWIIIIIVILILAGIWIFYFYSKNKTPKTVTLSPTPALTASPSSIYSPTVSPMNVQSPATTKVKIFMIAPDDNGTSGIKIGCGDSAVAVTREVPETQAVLKAAMEQLVSIKDKNYGESGLYNPLYQSSLTLESASINNGKATIKFTGTLTLVGTCEDPRIEAQLEQTALQFPTVQSVDILINDQNLRDLTSQQG